MPPIRVSLDVSTVPAKPAGAGRYIFQLAKGLASDSQIDLILFTRNNDAQRWKDISAQLQVLPVVPKYRPARLMWEQWQLPSYLGKLSPQLHHGPHYTMPERATLPKLVTVHDMTFFDHPEWHEKFKVPVFQRAIRKAAQNADAIVAVSQITATSLQERFGESHVKVIPLGVDHERFHPAQNVHQETEDQMMLNPYGISGDFIAFVGTLEPRKDLPTLIRAFDRLADKHSSLQLVIAGGDGWGVDAINQAQKEMRHANRVIRTGFIGDEVVPALLRNALAVAYPSLYEGFGLPALEALACAAPLVTTRGSAMEEVVNQAALLVDPGDTDALAEALDEVISSETATQLRQKGPQIASSFTWESCVDEHIALYKEII